MFKWLKQLTLKGYIACTGALALMICVVLWAFGLFFVYLLYAAFLCILISWVLPGDDDVPKRWS